MNADQIVAVSLGLIFLLCGLYAFCISWRKVDEETQERVQSFLDRV